MTPAPDPADLVQFALDALKGMQLPDGTFCFEVRSGSMAPEGRSPRYTLMTCLGLLRASAAGHVHGFDVAGIAEGIFARLEDSALKPGDFGLALWLSARLGSGHGAKIADRLRASLPAAGGLEAREGMEVAWIALGAAEAQAGGTDGLRDVLEPALERMLGPNRAASGLMYHRGIGRRRRFPNFATQIYSLLALATIGGLRSDDRCISVARALADTLIDLQLPDGGWPWIFDVQRGAVVEPFEVYVVHQDAMAPMAFLALYEVTQDERYRAAAASGLPWVTGQNALGVSLWDRQEGILYRSIRRRPPWDRAVLYASTAACTAGLPSPWRLGRGLELNRTDRPYHLGWILEAWAGREGMVFTPGGG